MKKLVIILLGIYTVCFSVSCRKKETDDCPNCPKVDELKPASGKKGDTIVIIGRNFSEVLNENIVMFNGTIVPASLMISGNATKLKVLVPPKCGTGSVEVKRDDELYSENGPIFTYKPETVVSVFAGSSTGTSGNTATGVTLANTRFNAPTQVAVDPSNNIYVLAAGNTKIVKLDVTTGQSKVLSDGSSQVSNPTALAVDENSIVYVSSYEPTGMKSTIFKYTPGSSFPTFYCNDFEAGRKHVSLSPEGSGKFYIGRVTTNLSIVLPDITYYTPANGHKDFTGDAGNVIYYKNGTVYQLNSIVAMKIYQTEFSKYNVKDTVETVLIDNLGGLNMSLGLVVDDGGNAYISDTENNRILKYSSSGAVTTLISTGLNKPQGIAMDKLGNIYVADTGNNCIKKIIFD